MRLAQQQHAVHVGCGDADPLHCRVEWAGHVDEVQLAVRAKPTGALLVVISHDDLDKMGERHVLHRAGQRKSNAEL